ncbi:MAG: trehalose-phosphatase [Herpetosiphon sp.]
MHPVATAIHRLLSTTPAALITDIDGTISAIAPTSAAAFVPAPVQSALRALVDRLALVAAVSGRAAADAATMVDVPGMVLVGNHGLEIWEDGSTVFVPAARPYIASIAALMDDVATATAIALPGVSWENKGVTASIHYRLTEDPVSAGATIAAIIGPRAEQHGLRVMQGRMVWEIRPPLSINKGTAVRDLISTYHVRAVVFLGDDRTDVDAMQMLRTARAAGTVEAINVGVLADEMPPEVRAAADVLVDGVADVAAVLADLVTLLSE